MSQNNVVFQFLKRVFCPEWESVIAATGRICSWGIPLAECYGVRLPNDYDGEVPPQMLMMDVPEAEYVVFEHGAFEYENQNCGVEEKIGKAMASFDYSEHGYQPDTSAGRVMYLFHAPNAIGSI